VPLSTGRFVPPYWRICAPKFWEVLSPHPLTPIPIMDTAPFPFKEVSFEDVCPYQLENLLELRCLPLHPRRHCAPLFEDFGLTKIMSAKNITIMHGFFSSFFDNFV